MKNKIKNSNISFTALHAHTHTHYSVASKAKRIKNKRQKYIKFIKLNTTTFTLSIYTFAPFCICKKQIKENERKKKQST